jgi:hypothetical protein
MSISFARVVFVLYLLAKLGSSCMAPKGKGVRTRLLQRDCTNEEAAPAHKRIRGIRQRLAPSPTCSHERQPSSGGVKRRMENKLESADTQPFNFLMRQKWADGKLSALEVLEFCKAAGDQHASGVERLNKRNINPKNACRDLISALGMPQFAPRISWIELDSANGKVSHAILCPIDVVEATLKRPSLFPTRLRGESGAVPRFWEGLRGHVTHDVVREIVDEMFVPCGFHGDAAPTSKTQGLMSFSWNSLVVDGSTKDTRNLFTTFNKRALTDSLLQQLLKRFVWAFEALAKGRMPDLDWRGNPHSEAGRTLCGGWRFAIIQIRGDCEFFSEALYLERWSDANCCFLCDATLADGPCCYTRAGPAAGWRGTLRSHPRYLRLLRRSGRPVAELLRLSTLRLEGIAIDVLHTMDLGVSSHVIANIFVETMSRGHYGGNQSLQACGLAAALKAWYQTHRDAYKIQGELSYSRIKSSSDWPKLKCKAAATRHLSKFALHLARVYHDGTAHDAKKVGVAELLCRFYDILSEGDRFLSNAQKDELSRLGALFLTLYGDLSKEAVTNGVRAWKLTPKFHAMIHICEQQAFLNPRFSWTYRDEDFQRLLKQIAVQCHPSTVPHTVLYRWLIGIFV